MIFTLKLRKISMLKQKNTVLP